LKLRSIGNTTDEDDFVDSDDKEDLPDFVWHEVSGTTSEDGLVAEIQDAIDNLNLTLSGAEEVDSEDRPILSLNDLEAQPVILDGKLAITAQTRTWWDGVKARLETDIFFGSPLLPLPAREGRFSAYPWMRFWYNLRSLRKACFSAKDNPSASLINVHRAETTPSRYFSAD
jgi:hypothetical protein